MKTLKSLERLQESLAKLPSVGKRSAERMAFAMLEMDDEDLNVRFWPLSRRWLPRTPMRRWCTRTGRAAPPLRHPITAIRTARETR